MESVVHLQTARYRPSKAMDWNPNQRMRPRFRRKLSLLQSWGRQRSAAGQRSVENAPLIFAAVDYSMAARRVLQPVAARQNPPRAEAVERQFPVYCFLSPYA